MIDFVTFGVIVDDIVFPDGQTRMGVLGGGGPQTAWGIAAALGSGARVGLAAGVGDDLGADTLDPLRAAMSEHVMSPKYLDGLTLTTADLGDDVGLMGALALAHTLTKPAK